MDFNLNQVDDGATVKDRLWNSHSVLPATFDGRLGTRDPYMFVLNKAEMGGSARAFDMIDRTNKISGLYSALLQFVLRAVELVLQANERAKKETAGRVPYPIEMFLETVVESEESARSHAGETSDTSARANIVRQYYQLDVSSDAIARLYPDRSTDDSPLLRDTHGRAVIQYRLWILVERELNFPQKLNEVLQIAVAEVEKRTTATPLAVDNRSLREYNKLTGTNASDGTFDIRRVLTKHEQWAVINSHGTLLDALYAYTGDRSFLNREARTASAHESLGSPTNPFYLGAVFAAARQFNCLDPRTDPAQARWLAYVGPVLNADGGETGAMYMRFPRPQRVLPVTEERHGVRFTLYYTPDYQRWNAQRRLLCKELQSAQAKIAAAPALPRPRAAAEATLRAAEAFGFVPRAPASDDDDDDTHLAGCAGDERQEAANREAVQARATLARTNLSVADENRAATSIWLARAGITQRFAEGAAIESGDARRTGCQMQLDARFIDVRASEQHKAIDNAIAGNIAMSSIHTLAQYYQRERAAILECADAPERCVRYTLLQAAALRDYMLSCTSPLADISVVGCTINAFMARAQAQGQAHFTHYKFFDRKLSVFGHMMVRELVAMDQVYHTYSVHGLQTAMVAAQCDAYRVAHTLKLNVLVTGPPELGKSRALEHVEARAIPGTLLVAARRTEKSFSSSEPHNDECEGYHEAPHAWLLSPSDMQKDKGGTKASSADDAQIHEMFKAKLTSMIVRTGSLTHDAQTNTYRQTMRVSEQMMTYVLCSNLSSADMAPAVRSRMFEVQVADFHREDATIGDKGLDEKNMSRTNHARRVRCDWEFRLLQALHYHAEKLIAIGALSAPTLATLMVFTPIFVDVLENRHGIKVPIRSLIKMELLVRHFVIRRALFALYCAPLAPFAGQTISIEHLLRIDPWLHDDPEILFFVFEFMRAQYVDPHVAVVARALRTYVSTRCATPAIFERYRAVQNHTLRPRAGAESVKHGAPSKGVPIGNYVASAAPPPVAYGSAAAAAADALATATWADVGADNAAFDFNRVMIRQRQELLVVELESIIAQDETLRLNREQINRVLVQMSGQTVSDYEYEPNHEFDGTLGAESFPVVPRTNRPKKSSLLVTSAPHHNVVTVHVSVLRTASEDPIEAVIRACSDRNMPVEKMLRGQPVTPNKPHIYGVRQSQRNHNITHVVADRSSFAPSLLCMLGEEASGAPVCSEERVERVARDRFKQHVAQAVALVGMSVEEYAVRRRLEAIDLPAEAWRAFSFRALAAQIASNPEHYAALEEQIDYPSDISVDVSQTKFLADVRTLLAGLSPDEARSAVKGRVTYLYSSYPEGAERAALAATFKGLGLSIDIDERAYRFSAAESKRIEVEAEVARAECRKEAEAVRAELEAAKARARADHAAKKARLEAEARLADGLPVPVRPAPPAHPVTPARPAAPVAPAATGASDDDVREASRFYGSDEGTRQAIGLAPRPATPPLSRRPFVVTDEMVRHFLETF